MPDEDLVKYFIDETNKKLEKVTAKVDTGFKEIHKRIDKLYISRWKTQGGTAAVSALISGIIAIIVLYLKMK